MRRRVLWLASGLGELYLEVVDERSYKRAAYRPETMDPTTPVAVGGERTPDIEGDGWDQRQGRGRNRGRCRAGACEPCHLAARQMTSGRAGSRAAAQVAAIPSEIFQGDTGEPHRPVFRG